MTEAEAAGRLPESYEAARRWIGALQPPDTKE